MTKLKTFEEKCINNFKKRFPKTLIKHATTWETECEWCGKTSQVCQVNHIPIGQDTGTVMMYFEDKNFRLQSEWWVCGKCKNS